MSRVFYNLSFAFVVFCIFLLISTTECKEKANKKMTQFDKLPFPSDSCNPGQKLDKRTNTCIGLQTEEVMAAMHWLTKPDISINSCKEFINVQGFHVCTDSLQIQKNTPVKKQQQKHLSSTGDGYPDFVANTLNNNIDNNDKNNYKKCTVWSVIATQFCDDVGSLTFEKEMATRGCNVEVFQYLMYIDGQLCKPKGSDNATITTQFWDAPEYNNRLHIHRIIVWEKRCYACLYKKVLALLDSVKDKENSGVLVDIFKLQSRFHVDAYTYDQIVSRSSSSSSSSSMQKPSSQLKATGADIYGDVYDGIQYVILADLFLYIPTFLQKYVGQIHTVFPFTTYSLIDGLGREAENGYNMWASSYMLQTSGFKSIHSEIKSLYGNEGNDGPTSQDIIKPNSMAPVLFNEQLADDVGIDATKEHFFVHSFLNINHISSKLTNVHVDDGTTSEPKIGSVVRSNTKTKSLPTFTLPEFCHLPTDMTSTSSIVNAKYEVSQFIAHAINARCHPERMWLACDHSRTYAQFLPCPKDLHNELAFDYAVSQGWCDFSHQAANIEPLKTAVSVLSGSSETSLSSLRTRPNSDIRITVPPSNLKSDFAPPVLRLLFFFTVYTDAPSVARLLARLYSPYHFYLLHIDPNGASQGFEDELKILIKEQILSPNFSNSHDKNTQDGDFMGNVAIAKDVHIVYGASTASILLSRAMSWALTADKRIARAIDATIRIHYNNDNDNHITQLEKSWDYFLPLTGFDYPLVSLSRMVDILTASYSKKRYIETNQQVLQMIDTASTSTESSVEQEAGYQPFLMAWHPSVSKHIIALQTKFSTIYTDDEDIAASFAITWSERGSKAGMGTNSMEVRAYSYAPPLQCNGAHGYYRLDTRAARNDSQWLFPRSGPLKDGRGRATLTDIIGNANTNMNIVNNGNIPALSEEQEYEQRIDPSNGKRKTPRMSRNFNAMRGPSYSNVDGKHRSWKKSDPGTSAAYDRRSVEYMINTIEGKKYYHYFRHMLLGSEEHYYITLLYNWKRTQTFVTSISAQAVWNTWILGTYDGTMGGFKTHTHFVTSKEMSILKGMSKRGVFWGRKMSVKRTPDVLDALDEFIDANDSTEGKYWPGYAEYNVP